MLKLLVISFFAISTPALAQPQTILSMKTNGSAGSTDAYGISVFDDGTVYRFDAHGHSSLVGNVNAKYISQILEHAESTSEGGELIDSNPGVQPCFDAPSTSYTVYIKARSFIFAQRIGCKDYYLSTFLPGVGLKKFIDGFDALTIYFPQY